MFHDRRTYASSRSRCSRPERGQPKVPFSRCRCHILGFDYRWGSIWSNETATATTGGPRVIDVFYGNGVPSGPNYLLFSDSDRLPDSLRDRSKVGWSPTPHAPVLGALRRALDRKPGGLVLWPDVWLRELPNIGSARACGVGVCPRLVSTLGALGETSGPRIDRIPLTRPPWWDRQYRELKKLHFSPPSKCPIDPFGPVANRAILKQLHVTSRSSSPSRADSDRGRPGF